MTATGVPAANAGAARPIVPAATVPARTEDFGPNRISVAFLADRFGSTRVDTTRQVALCNPSATHGDGSARYPRCVGRPDSGRKISSESGRALGQTGGHTLRRPQSWPSSGGHGQPRASGQVGEPRAPSPRLSAGVPSVHVSSHPMAPRLSRVSSRRPPGWMQDSARLEAR